MALGSGVWEQPAGLTATVERCLERTRVTLRPCGFGRWTVVAFLLLWLAGWACGELFALGIMLGMAGSALGLTHMANSPAGGAAVGIAAFMLVWLTFWTIGGIAALTAVARMGWGKDVLTIGQGEWTVWQGAFGRGRSQSIDASRVRRVSLRAAGGALVAETDERTISLTSFGTSADRQWLCGVLQEAARVTEEGREGLAAAAQRPVDAAAAGFRVEPLSEGETRIAPIRSLGQRIAGAVVILLIALFWNGIVSVFVAAGLGLMPVKDEGPGGAMAPGAWGYWLFLTPFILVGLGLAWAAVWVAFGHEEWRAAPDGLEVHRRIFHLYWPSRYTGGSLALEMQSDSDGDPTWRLFVYTDGRRQSLQGGDPARLRTLGLLLAEHTGWEFHDTAA